jgi:hypothetical protein
MKASELTIGDNFKRNGLLLTVATIESYKSKTGIDWVSVSCYTGNNKTIDSYFNFKSNTKVK